MPQRSVNTPHERLPGIDALRCFLVILVVGLHAGMTYMAYTPQWWYTADSRQSLFFTFLVIFLDAFPMTALFLLAGRFTPSSLARGRGRFIKNKLYRLALPWLAGMTLVVPLLALASRRRYGLPEIPFLQFVREEFFGVWYQQGHFWFLGVLLLFMFLSAAVLRRPEENDGAAPSPPGWLDTALLVAVTAAAYFASSRFLRPADDWMHLGYLVYFQPARLAGYAAAFWFGIRAAQRGWFAPGSWIPRRAFWGVLATAAAAALLAWKMTGAAPEGAAAGAAEAVLYSLTASSLTFFLLGVFLRSGPAADRRLGFFAPCSFGIYWWHQCILLPATALLAAAPVSPFIKFAAVTAFTVVVCRYLALGSARLDRLLRKRPARSSSSR